MSSTLLELTRAAHEEVERLERLIVKDLQHEPSSNRERLFQNHRVRNMIDSITFSTGKLIDIYEDKDSARKDEIAALGGQTASGTNVFSAFYDRLKEIREYHRRHPNARVADSGEEYEELLKEEPHIEFSGEVPFMNSNALRTGLVIKPFLRYKEYLKHVLEYLTYFFQRTEPLQDLDRIFSKVEAEFEELWADGKVEEWKSNDSENGHIAAPDSLIDLDYYSTVEDLIEVGPEKLKEALAALGLKTGGTVTQRAERLFLTKHTPLVQLDRKHFVKGSLGVQQNGAAISMQQADDSKETALMEAKMKRLCELLAETIVQTKENIEKKQALTYEEIDAERKEQEEIQDDTESDDDEQQIYNPLKLPMGWDGKPIPYWLYKLHGLGQEFKCEICGNHSYWGRRAFERHFKEWRHQHGMRCLGIPNTKNFNEVTCIQEAKVLWERIQERQGVNKWRPDLEEEYEDMEGNIYNKKTYTDLHRQGLI
ncbi:hypothetical protein GIB67_042246 [Kingdonia uniflora]|uniref:Matrin-type domain-containing protein n=1 Tax=Kingdonia uniflora TaxID=39325 RepID=A0A7J7LDX6_9MAGN|nr:hypothetical protein GIB67_042246 [Kingdonia uniflora]